MNDKIPDGYKIESGICWGRRTPSVLEIKYHDPKTKNAIAYDGYLKLHSLSIKRSKTAQSESFSSTAAKLSHPARI